MLINGYSDYGGSIRVPIGYRPAGGRNIVARLQLEKCEIRDCTATADGGAIYATTNYQDVQNGGDVRLFNTAITNCTAGNAGGAMRVESVSLFMADVTIRGGRQNLVGRKHGQAENARNVRQDNLRRHLPLTR